MHIIMRYPKLFLILFTIFINMNFISFFKQEKPLLEEDPIKNCQNQGGEWKLLNDGCANNCIRYESESPVFCTMALSYNCSCNMGEDVTKCFDTITKKCRLIKPAP